jgi:hypothetical protein
MRPTAKATNRTNTFAAHKKAGVCRFWLAQTPAEAMQRNTSGESDRTSFIFFFESSCLEQNAAQRMHRFGPFANSQVRIDFQFVGMLQ